MAQNGGARAADPGAAAISLDETIAAEATTAAANGQAAPPEPDLEAARCFLEMLDPDAASFTFQCATDDPEKKKSYPLGEDGRPKDPLAGFLNLPPDALRPLVARNRKGAAVWVMVNEGDGRGRAAKNVIRARAVFADLDGAPIEPALRCDLEPHIVVESSPGRFHSYWLVQGLPLEQFEGVQRRIATMFNGDSVCDLPRVMRLPGFVHAKDPAAPFVSRIVHHQADRPPYSADDILRAFPPLEADGKGKGKPEGKVRDDLPPPLSAERLEELKAGHPDVFNHEYKSASERDFALACLACKLGWPEEDAVALLRATRRDGKGERRAYLWRTVTKAYARAAADDSEAEAKRSITTRLVEIAKAKADLFMTPAEIAYAAFEVDGHRETWPLKSRGFRYWLGRQFYEETKGRQAASAQAIGDALVTIEGLARYDGDRREVYLRVAEHGGRYYLDLADASWRAVEIGPDGWRVIDTPPVHFRRTRGTLPLPAPTPGGSLEPLRGFLNVDQDGFDLMLAWALAALRPAGPYPVLDISGEQGAAKSTAARVLRALIDPGEPMIRAAPKEERDLAIGVLNAHVLPLDNLSKVQPWLSDALCRFATGGGWACRQLYTDDEEVLIDAQRPIILTGIEELALRPDLKDRTVGVSLPVIEEDKRIEEGEFWRRFDAARPSILGALLDVMVVGLARLPGLRLDRLPRMADFAKWITACEPALGWRHGEFMDLYADNRAALTEIAIESNETIRMIRDDAICHDEHESVGSLLTKLRSLCGDDRERIKGLPKSARALGGLLRRYAPELRAAGLEVIFPPRTENAQPVTIRRRERVPAQRTERTERTAGQEFRGFQGCRSAEHSKPQRTGRTERTGTPTGEKANEINGSVGPVRSVRSAGTTCIHCHEPIDLDQGYSVISGGGYLHNTCVDAWVQS